MRLVDANVLLYAVNSDADAHERSRRWLDAGLSGEDTVAFAWIAPLAFVRLSTKEGLFPTPLSMQGAMDRVDAWLAAPSAVVLEPTIEHSRVLRSLLTPLTTAGNLVNDAHLASLAVEHKCEIVSFSLDFSRFTGVRWREPE